MPESVAQFAARIKSKYPDYQSVPDKELVDRIIAKHPEYKSQVDLGPEDTILQLQHKHNLNREAEAQAQFAPIAAGAKMIAEPMRMMGAFGGPVGAAIGETAAQGVELAGGARQDFSPTEVATQAAIPAAADVAGKIIGTVGPKLANPIREAAQRQYSKVIGATTKENKLLSEKVVPQLLSNEVRAVTRKGLERKATGLAEKADVDLESAYAALPQDAKVKFVPVLQQIQKAKDKLIVKGTNEVVDQELHNALTKVQDKVLKIAGGSETVSPIAPEATVATARSARQAFDKVVAKRTKIFGKTGKETVKLEAQKEASNAIRHELAQEYPDIAEINKQFNLWKTVSDLVSETNIRTASHATPLGERMLTAGGIAGTLGRGLGQAALYGSGIKLLSKAINSTAWRTVSAVEKNKLADLLASGKGAEAEIYLTKILGRTATLPSVDQHDKEQ